MTVDLDTGNLLSLLAMAYDHRDIVSKTELVTMAVRARLGGDGLRAVRALPPGFYREPELREWLTEAIFLGR